MPLQAISDSKTILLTAAGLGLIFGLANREVNRFERLAANEIRSKLTGENAKVEVSAQLDGLFGGLFGEVKRATIRASHFSTDRLPLFTEPERSKRGKVRELKIELDDFTLAGLRVEHLDASIPDCRFDLSLAMREGQMRLSQSGLGTGSVRLLEKDLENFVLRKFREIKRVSVKVERGHLFVEGYGEFLIIHTNFLVIAKLEAEEGVRLTLVDTKVFFDDGAAGPEAKRVVLETLNPVVDLDKDLGLFGTVYVRGMKLEKGVLEAWGDTRIPDLPAELGPPG